LLEWVETGGWPVIPPGHTGYGTDAIRNLIPYELGGVVDLIFDAAGVRCRIELPSSAWSQIRSALIDRVPRNTQRAVASGM